MQCDSLFLIPTVPSDIKNIIDSLNNTNSSGYDDITTNVIKSVSDIIAPVLSHITNLCLESGEFPDKLKLAVIKPLYKKGNKRDPANYRPIALLPVFSKIIEKVIYDKLYSFFERNNLFAAEQYGFRRQRNINMAIFNI